MCNLVLRKSVASHFSKGEGMQPVQECLCRTVLFQGSVVTISYMLIIYFIAFKAYHHGNIR